MTAPRAGVYRHYKGPLYEVLIPQAHDADYDGRTVVIYIGLVLDAAHEGPRVAVRTVEYFEQLVHDDGTVCWEHQCDKHSQPRFEYLGPEFRREMLPNPMAVPRGPGPDRRPN